MIFAKLYDRVMLWSRHRYASKYLCGLSFSEAVFFPIPPDVMLAPMALARPQRASQFALLATLASVIGGAIGYLIGHLLNEPVVVPLVEAFHYQEKMAIVREWFQTWGIWVIFLAGFSPIPYKVFTISAGVMSMAFVPFMLTSLVGRGLRFFLVAGLMAWGGPRMEAKLRQYVEVIGWSMVVLAVVAYLLLK